MKSTAGRIVLLFTLALCIALTGAVLAGNGSARQGFDAKKQVIALRLVGHQLLLQSGDSTSRVLPVRKISDTEYEIRFEKTLSFQPDSLVRIVKRSLATGSENSEYVVSVLSCTDMQVVFGYAVTGPERKETVPCSGRRQPKACYLINIKFPDNALLSSQQQRGIYQGMPVLLILGCGLYLFITRRKKTVFRTTNRLMLGETIFNHEARLLSVKSSETVLTTKESNILLIFAKSPNEIIDRSRLQKEIWEDEGVIVGRSLDMFISKLRKKLAQDPSLQLVNIHGKGYKLEIS
jgi:hypothetical protein